MSYGMHFEQGSVNDPLPFPLDVELVRSTVDPSGLSFPRWEEEPLLWEGDQA